jgi:LCP family protein required for cell wall assembly
VGAAFASALLPGVGQLLAGRRRRGLVLLAISVPATVALIWFPLARPLTVATWAVQPTALRWLLVANGVGLAFRVFASADAYLVARGAAPRPALLGVGGIVGLLTVVVLAYPHLWAGRNVVIEYDLITTVFRPAPTTTTTIPPSTTARVPATATTTTTEAPPLVLQPPPSTTTTIPLRLWDGTERLNVLLLGGDAGPGRRGVRTDTVILASLDPATGHAALFSVPRNMARVPLPADLDIWSCDCFPDIINALWKYGSEHPDRFPGAGPPGAEALKLAIGEMTGLPIHHYALVNLEGFVELVDAIGGVDITVPARVYDADYPNEDGTREVIDILPGEYRMDGHTALAYARSRRSSDDYSRIQRQRCVLRAFAAQADPVTVIRAFPEIANAIKNNVSTDIPLERLPDLIALLPELDSDELVSVRFVPPDYTGRRTPEGYNTPDLEAIRHAVDTVVSLPPLEAIELLGLDDLDEACG